MRISSQVTVFGGESTHWLVIRIPIRDGRAKERHLPPPLVAGYELETVPIIDTLRRVATRAERREIDRVVKSIVGEEGSP